MIFSVEIFNDFHLVLKRRAAFNLQYAIVFALVLRIKFLAKIRVRVQ